MDSTTATTTPASTSVPSSESSTAASGGGGSSATVLKGVNKRMLYVGGLEERVGEKELAQAFVPFGPIANVDIPVDSENGGHRGFGFVEFEDVSDASDAIANMDGAELFGRVLKVNVARPGRIGTEKGGVEGKAIEWMKKALPSGE